MADSIVYLIGTGPGNPELMTVRGLQCLARADVVLYDRVSDPDEVINLAADPANAELVELYRGRLESMITAEIGADDEPWVTERPHLLGPMRFHGD